MMTHRNKRWFRALLAATLWIATCGLAAGEPLVPMAKQPSAKPRLRLRLVKAPLEPRGVADVRITRPVRRLHNTKVVQIERQAKSHLTCAEGLVRQAYGPKVGRDQRRALLNQATGAYARWETKVRRLVRARELQSPVYQEWATKTWEAQLVKLHAAVRAQNPSQDPARALNGQVTGKQLQAMLTRLYRLPADDMQRELSRAWKGLYGGARSADEANLMKRNPLALLPQSSQKPRSARDGHHGTVAYTPKRNPLSPKTWRPKTYQVRSDVAYVWAPGVARTYTEFEKQKQVLLKNGVLALQANTGSWRNPFRNAYDIAKAVNEARKVTQNPNVKVVLVGYSQGNNSVYAFLQAEGRNPKEKAMFRELQKNVVQVQDLNSAARGTPMADLGVVLTKVLTGRGREIKDLDGALDKVGQFLKVRDNKVRHKVAQYVRRHQEGIGKAVRTITGRNTKTLPSRIRRRIADGIHDVAVGSLESLTTWRGKELMSNPRLLSLMKQIPVTNTVGVVPHSRAELVPTAAPLDQRPGWQYMLKRGLANDYQVPEKNQRLNPVLKGAVDMPTQAIGHWGITGVQMAAGKKVIHNERHYPQFSPELHTFNMLQQLRAMGL